MQSVAVRMPHRVQSGVAVETGGIDQQRVTIPFAHGVSKPGRLQIPALEYSLFS